MDMRQLLDDFKKHVDSMDDYAIKQSIEGAIEHSINSSFLECPEEKEVGIMTKSITQLWMQSNYQNKGFAYASLAMGKDTSIYIISDLGGVAA